MNSSSPTLTGLPPNYTYSISSNPLTTLPYFQSEEIYLRNQNLITASNAHGNLISISVSSARTNGQYGGLVDLLDGAFGKEDATGGLGFGLDALNEDAVQEGNEVLDVAESLID